MHSPHCWQPTQTSWDTSHPDESLLLIDIAQCASVVFVLFGIHLNIRCFFSPKWMLLMIKKYLMHWDCTWGLLGMRGNRTVERLWRKRSKQLCIHWKASFVLKKVKRPLCIFHAVQKLSHAWKEGWYLCGYISEKPDAFLTPVQFCLNQGQSLEICSECDRASFLRCSWCSNHFCFSHFVTSYHFCENFVE